MCSVKLYPAFHVPLRQKKKRTNGQHVRPVAIGSTLRQILLFLRLRLFPEASRRFTFTLSLPGHPLTTAKAHLPHSPLCHRGPQPQVKPHNPERRCGAAQQVMETGFSPHWLLPFLWKPFPWVIPVSFQWCIVMPVHINHYRINHNPLASWSWWGPGLNSTYSHTWNNVGIWLPAMQVSSSIWFERNPCSENICAS